jgi:uncharacterized membrane protein
MPASRSGREPWDRIGASVFETAFRFLFKYEPLVFEQGQFVLGATRSMWLLAALAVAGAVYVAWTYWQVRALEGRPRVILLATRVALLLIVIFTALRPMLLLRVAVPQQNFVGVLIDDSRSMQVNDEAGGTRADYVRREAGSPDAPLLASLGTRFVPRVFRFSSSTERLGNAGDLTFQGTGTRLGDAIDRAREELSGLPVAGLVVVSDGADNAETTIDQPVAALRAQGIPVFAVGVGKEQLTRDVQISRVETPRRVLEGASLVIDLVLSQTGYAGATVPLTIEEDGRVVGVQDVTLPPDGEARTVKVRFKAGEAGLRTFSFSVPEQPGEEVARNNRRDALIEVRDTRERILLAEGEPRPEAKFIRQATETDDHLNVVLLLRTAMATANAPDKFWRGGVESPDELQFGFPTTRAELFRYRGLILGSFEAAAFTPEQQRMIEDFVAVRGGGLMVLGGARSLGEGGWAGTPLSNALPITIGGVARDPIMPPLELSVAPTAAGQVHPAVQIADTPEAADAKWKELPTLFSVNAAPVASLKPGASLLLSGTDRNGRQQVVLGWQRYGRGKALVLPVQDTWLWRMHASMAVEDTTHRYFWQRLTRWLVDGVPEPAMVTLSPDRPQPGDPITITAEVFDEEYRGINDARVFAHVTSPSGRIEDVPMEWTVEQDGEYRAQFTPTEDGVYRVAVDGARRNGDVTARGTASVRVGPSDAEYFDAAMRAPLLRRLAEETGGRFFRSGDTSSLADAISYSGRGVTVVEERDLWDMPIVLVAVLGLMAAEWLTRRKWGLA